MKYPWIAFGEYYPQCEWHAGPYRTKKEALKAFKYSNQYLSGYICNTITNKSYSVTLGPEFEVKLVPYTPASL